MSGQTVSVASPNATIALVDQEGKLTREGNLYFLKLCNSFQLITWDTTAGPSDAPLPPASTAPNYEVVAVKISSDGNMFGVAASTGDTLNTQGTWAAARLDIGTAQGAMMTLKSDGHSSWYAK